MLLPQIRPSIISLQASKFKPPIRYILKSQAVRVAHSLGAGSHLQSFTFYNSIKFDQGFTRSSKFNTLFATRSTRSTFLLSGYSTSSMSFSVFKIQSSLSQLSVSFFFLSRNTNFGWGRIGSSTFETAGLRNEKFLGLYKFLLEC